MPLLKFVFKSKTSAKFDIAIYTEIQITEYILSCPKKNLDRLFVITALNNACDAILAVLDEKRRDEKLLAFEERQKRRDEKLLTFEERYMLFPGDSDSESDVENNEQNFLTRREKYWATLYSFALPYLLENFPVIEPKDFGPLNPEKKLISMIKKALSPRYEKKLNELIVYIRKIQDIKIDFTLRAPKGNSIELVHSHDTSCVSPHLLFLYWALRRVLPNDIAKIVCIETHFTVHKLGTKKFFAGGWLIFGKFLELEEPVPLTWFAENLKESFHQKKKVRLITSFFKTK